MERLRRVIRNLEKQRADLGKAIAILREIEASGALEFDRNLTLDELERSLVATALARADGSQTEAARALGVGRDKLRYKAKKHGLRL